MTKQEYRDYERRFLTGMESLGVNNISLIDGESEGYFSWQPCDVCRTRLGGTRYECNGWNPTEKEVVDFSACQNCYYYAEYGQLDDQTMLDIEGKELC